MLKVFTLSGREKTCDSENAVNIQFTQLSDLIPVRLDRMKLIEDYLCWNLSFNL